MTYDKNGELVDKYYIGNYLNLFWGFEQMHLKGNNLYAYGISDNKTYFNKSSEESQASIVKLSLSFKIDVEISTGGKIEVDENLYKAGDKVTLKVKPEDGYVLGAIDGVEVSKVDDETYTFIMPAEDVTLTPKFVMNDAINNIDGPIPNSETGGFVVGMVSILLLVLVILLRYRKNNRIYKV